MQFILAQEVTFAFFPFVFLSLCIIFFDRKIFFVLVYYC